MCIIIICTWTFDKVTLKSLVLIKFKLRLTLLFWFTISSSVGFNYLYNTVFFTYIINRVQYIYNVQCIIDHNSTLY